MGNPNGDMTEVLNKDANRVLKFVIVFLVFPILLLVFHALLLVPSLFIQFLLVHFEGHPMLWARLLSVVTLFPACWGAVAICKWVWPASK